MDIQEWCYRQCEIQHATAPEDIQNMLSAYGFATGIAETPGIEMWEITFLGMLVDPIANPNGRFRTGPAVFMNGGTAIESYRIESALNRLVSFKDDIIPDMYYQELMYIHPFKDGNGRVGAIVYNLLNGTLDNPIDPPDYK